MLPNSRGAHPCRVGYSCRLFHHTRMFRRAASSAAVFGAAARPLRHLRIPTKAGKYSMSNPRDSSKVNFAGAFKPTIDRDNEAMVAEKRNIIRADSQKRNRRMFKKFE
jgi:hypothetical protein